MRRPWIGDQFRTGGFLILGESHYWNEEDADDPEMTNEVVTGVVNGKRLRFFTSVERAVTGCGPGETRPSVFWHSVAFANFCPGAARDRKSGATAEMWAEGGKQFPELLSYVKPSRLLFATKGSWNRTEGTDTHWEDGDSIHVDGAEHSTGFFSTKDRSVRAYSTFINHPSTIGWSADQWVGILREFMSRDSITGRH